MKSLGGKRYLLPALEPYFDALDCARFTYLEPMCGGAACLFEFGPRFQRRIISDINPELINVYRMIQTRYDDLITELQQPYYYFHKKEEPKTRERYLQIRASNPKEPIPSAARTLYLNRTCVNGMMRTNLSGGFNVSPGSYVDPVFCNPKLLHSAASFLSSVDIVGPMDVADFIPQFATKETLFFVDPPYHGLGKFQSFYGVFGDREQEKLVQTLTASGAPFIYTNRATEFILDLFQPHDVLMWLIPLKHDNQPVYTAKLIEEEVVVFSMLEPSSAGH